MRITLQKRCTHWCTRNQERKEEVNEKKRHLLRETKFHFPNIHQTKMKLKYSFFYENSEKSENLEKISR